MGAGVRGSVFCAPHKGPRLRSAPPPPPRQPGRLQGRLAGPSAGSGCPAGRARGCQGGRHVWAEWSRRTLPRRAGKSRAGAWGRAAGRGHWACGGLALPLGARAAWACPDPGPCKPRQERPGHGQGHWEAAAIGGGRGGGTPMSLGTVGGSGVLLGHPVSWGLEVVSGGGAGAWVARVALSVREPSPEGTGRSWGQPKWKQQRQQRQPRQQRQQRPPPPRPLIRPTPSTTRARLGPNKRLR